ncbi:hypothetical protein CBR_g45856 [Chara braunii]|uniref:Uncharacterized protein n=1 Tax=Chara braunii TaxID=69332 RepID=A0A388LZN8_CHABU|nr:hypothetical protein CBR_g45856 [Chara braunii]|eukprot:GBG87702.1 hypothetical protein CBR_g45856 [Chara braunii]
MMAVQRLISAFSCPTAAEQRQRTLGSSIPTRVWIAWTTRTVVCAGHEMAVCLNRFVKVVVIGMSRRRPSAEESVRMNVRSGCGCHLRREADPAHLLDGTARQRPEDLSDEGADVHRNGRQLWAECRQTLHQRGTETITRGVQRLHVDEGDKAAVEEAQGYDNVDGDDDCNSDDLPDIRPLGRKATNGRTTARKGPSTKSRRSKKMDDDTGRSDGEGGRNFWSVGDTIAFVRAKGIKICISSAWALVSPA